MNYIPTILRRKNASIFIGRASRIKYLQVIFLSIVFLTVSNLIHAQEFNIKLSEKHLNKVEKAESGKAKLKKYRKYYQKDSAKHVKKMEKYWQSRIDSLNELNGEEYKEKLAQVKDHLPDSSQVADSLKNKYVSQLPDSAQVADSVNSLGKNKAKEMLAENESIQEASDKATQYIDQAGKLKHLNNKDSLKSTAKAYSEEGAKYVENRAKNAMGMEGLEENKEALTAQSKMAEEYKTKMESENLDKFKNQVQQKVDVSQYQNQVKQYSDKENLAKQGKQKAKERATNFFQTKAKKLASTQNELSTLMKKYKSVANSNKLDKAVKRNSLEGKPLKERLFIGGYFNVNSTDPISLDLSPKIGYKVNQKWIVGVGGAYRKTFGSDTLSTNLNMPNDGFGFSGFTSYDAIKGFYLYGEYETLNEKIEATETSSSSAQWIDALNLGLGKKLSVHRKVNMDIIFTYNVLHDTDNALYIRPWTIKVGFSLSDLALLKK